MDMSPTPMKIDDWTNDRRASVSIKLVNRHKKIDIKLGMKIASRTCE